MNATTKARMAEDGVPPAIADLAEQVLKMQAKMEEMAAEYGQPQASDVAGDALRVLSRRLETTVAAHPLTAVGIALGLGLALGAYLKR